MFDAKDLKSDAEKKNVTGIFLLAPQVCERRLTTLY